MTMLLRTRQGRSWIATTLVAIVALVCLAGAIASDDNHRNLVFLPVLFFELFALVFAGGFAPAGPQASERETLLRAVCPRAPPA